MKAEDVPDAWFDAATSAYDAEHSGYPVDEWSMRAALAAVAPLIAAAERERCAKVAEMDAAIWIEKSAEAPLKVADQFKMHARTAREIASIIRAQGDA